MRMSTDFLPPGALRAVLAAAAVVAAVGVVGLGVVHPARVAARPAVALPAHEVCPTGGLTWAVTQFTAKADPLNPKDVTVTEAGTVRDDTPGNVTLQLPENAVVATPAQGSTTYPVYLTLDNNDLYPGQVAHFTGSSAEVGVVRVARGPISYQASWDNPGFAHCNLPAHLGSP